MQYKDLGDSWDVDSSSTEEYPTIQVTVNILDTLNNNRTSIRDHILFDLEHNQPDTYLWEEGNFECDCNRGLKMYNCDDFECGSGRFRVNLINPKTNSIFYKEF